MHSLFFLGSRNTASHNVKVRLSKDFTLLVFPFLMTFVKCYQNKMESNPTLFLWKFLIWQPLQRKNNIIEFKAQRKLRISPGLTPELPCGGWVPEDIHQLPLMAAIYEMEAVPMAGNPGTLVGSRYHHAHMESVEKG